MNTMDVVKSVMKSRHFSNKALAEKLGYKNPSGVTNRLNSKNMGVDTLLKMCDVLGCEIVIKSKLSDKQSWVLDGKDEVKSVSDEEAKALIER